MSPIDISAGHSGNTELKQAQFREIFRVLATIGGGAIRKARVAGWNVSPTFLYLDLTSGPGLVHGAPGSPLIATNELAALGFSWRAFFFELDGTARFELEYSLEDHGVDLDRCSLHADHQALPDVMTSWLAGAPYGGSVHHGIAYVDQNGGGRLPFEALGWLSSQRAFEKVDLVAHISPNGAYKRPRSERLLSEDIAACGKRLTLIREPVDRWQWTILVMTNFLPISFRKLGFHDLASDAGQRILWRLEHRAGEIRGQEGLF